MVIHNRREGKNKKKNKNKNKGGEKHMRGKVYHTSTMEEEEKSSQRRGPFAVLQYLKQVIPNFFK